jgi:hypothetical protein
MKKSSAAADAGSSESKKAADESDAAASGAGASLAGEKKKKGIHWADEGGGLLREVQIIEVAKIKRSTADYSNTRELSKRERLAEKETHLAKTEDAMQRNTEWRTYVARDAPTLLDIVANFFCLYSRPQPLALSIVVLDNISIVADSAEKVLQENRLAHILEIRYVVISFNPRPRFVSNIGSVSRAAITTIPRFPRTPRSRPR